MEIYRDPIILSRFVLLLFQRDTNEEVIISLLVVNLSNSQGLILGLNTSQMLLPRTKPPGLLGIGAENITKCSNIHSLQVNSAPETQSLHARGMTSSCTPKYM